MWWDHAGFSLALHGDTYERDSWHRYQQQLSGYESIWLKYVVPLTNRIDSRISPTDDNWIMIRRVSQPWLHFAMANYSTFYYFCRAKDLQATAPQFYEAVFNFMRMCTYNLFALLGSCDEILGKGRMLTAIVTRSPICNTIKRYRDILLKNPVVGRSRIIGRGSLPNESALVRLTAQKKKNATLTWEDTQQLTPRDFIKAEDTANACFPRLMLELQNAWQTIDGALEVRRAEPAFLASMGLDATGHVPGDTGSPLVLNVRAPGASGDVF